MEAAEAYLAYVDDFTDADAPMVHQLLNLATQLDDNPTSTRLIDGYRATFKYLNDARGSNSNESNEAEDFLNDL